MDSAVDPGSSELLRRKHGSTRTNALAELFFGDCRENHDGDGVAFLVDDAASPKEACRRYGLDIRYEVTEIATVSEI